MHATELPPTIGYLLKTYPKVSETFILREILALERQGIRLHLFVLRRPHEQTVHALTSRVRATVTYMPFPLAAHRFRLFCAHVALCLRRPWRYLRTLVWVIRRREAERFEEWSQAGYLAWALTHTRVQHLHAHFINKAGGVAELTHHLLGLPYSITAHAKDIYLSEPTVLDRKMRRAKLVLTCTDYNRQFLQELSTSSTPIHRIYHGLDAQWLVPRQPDEIRSPDGPPIILSVGRFREKKGFLCLIDACRHLRDTGYTFRCIIIGYGPLRDTMAQRIQALKLEEVVSLCETLPQEEIMRHYQRATMFVLPCQPQADGDRDGIPNVLMEAMAMQLPVISTTVASIPELITDRHNGLLVPPQDPHALAAAMRSLLDDARWRHILGHAGRKTVCRHFSADRNAAEIKSLLLRMLGASQQPGGQTVRARRAHV